MFKSSFSLWLDRFNSHTDVSLIVIEVVVLVAVVVVVVEVTVEVVVVAGGKAVVAGGANVVVFDSDVITTALFSRITITAAQIIEFTERILKV